MKMRYAFDVKIPGEDYKRAMALHVKLQGALAEVLQDEGLTTDGLKPKRLDSVDPSAPSGKGASDVSTKPLMEWIPSVADCKDTRR